MLYFQKTYYLLSGVAVKCAFLGHIVMKCWTCINAHFVAVAALALLFMTDKTGLYVTSCVSITSFHTEIKSHNCSVAVQVLYMFSTWGIMNPVSSVCVCRDRLGSNLRLWIVTLLLQYVNRGKNNILWALT